MDPHNIHDGMAQSNLSGDNAMVDPGTAKPLVLTKSFGFVNCKAAGGARTVYLGSPSSTGGFVVYIGNIGGTGEDCVVKNLAGAVTYATVSDGEIAMCVFSGSGWNSVILGATGVT